MNKQEHDRCVPVASVTIHTAHELRIEVRYVAAEDSFKSEANSYETVGHLKRRVLVAFDLHEGPTPDGNTVTYTLYHDKKPLDHPNQTLGDLAGHHHELRLNLVQQITQG
jgi:hypothetical protein